MGATLSGTAIDPASLDTDTPRTLDGRDYPEHLRAYEQLDSDLLPILEQHGPITFDGLVRHITEGRQRAAVGWWLMSAEWRGLVERRENGARGLLRLALTDRGRNRLTLA